MPARRRLEDLYQTGVEKTIDDGKGAVKVWIQKLNSVEVSKALRRANATRARVLSLRKDPTSDEYWDLWAQVEDIEDKDTLIANLMAPVMVRAQDRAEAELAAQEEWAKDDYIQGLKDIWESELSERHLTEPDEETRRVLAELEKFASIAEENAKYEIDAARSDFEAKDIEILRQEVMDRLIKNRSESAWVDEFHKCEIWLGVKDPNNHRMRYFDTREDIDYLSTPVLAELFRAYADINVDVIEGKDSEETPTSSPSSEQSVVVEMPVSSGLVALAQ